MAVNLESASGAAATSPRVDRRNAGARQDRWMLEFEKAFTAGADAPAGPAVGASPGMARPPLSAPSTPVRAAPAARAAALERDTAPESDRRAGGNAADAPSNVDAYTVTAATVAPGAAVAKPEEGVDATTTAGVSGYGSSVMGGAAAYAAPDAFSINARIAPSLVLLTGMGAPPPIPGLPKADAAARNEKAAAGTVQPADVKPYDKRAMHLFVDNQGVHAFIRDAALQSMQVQAVIQALAAEVAANGRQLASLTVNGKPVAARASAAHAEDEDAFLQHTAGRARTPALDYPSQPASKGTP